MNRVDMSFCTMGPPIMNNYCTPSKPKMVNIELQENGLLYMVMREGYNDSGI